MRYVTNAERFALREAEEKGKAQATLEIAQNCLRRGISVEMIALTTGLSIDKIQQLHSSEF